MDKSRLVAVDTNILLRLARRDEATMDALDMIRQRLAPVQLVVSPTVAQETAVLACEVDDPALSDAARVALGQLSSWGFFAGPLNAVDKAIVWNAAGKLLDSGLLPSLERNDALILAEASVMNCILLVRRGSHLLRIDRDKLALVFGDLDLPTPAIASPEALLNRFYR